MKRLSSKSACLSLLVWCVAIFAAPAGQLPKNVILLIGDGMGFEQVKAAGMYAHGAAGTLLFESFPYRGELTTHSANNPVTDSAAAATALATGAKVNNEVISQAIPGTGSDLETILERFQDWGRRVGLVTSAYVTHATPAAFAAHEASRLNYAAIATDYLSETRPNVLFGGSSYMSGAAGAGYTVVTDATGMFALNTEVEVLTSGQFGAGYMPYEYDGLGNLPHLSDMAATALAILDNSPEGFFLMVEGARIDHACHANDLVRAIRETIEFDNAVQAVVTWAAGRDDTLVIVMADHETGGLQVSANNGADNLPDVTWNTVDHTAANVPIFAWGVNAGLVQGVMDNTEVVNVIVPPAARLFTMPASVLLSGELSGSWWGGTVQRTDRSGESVQFDFSDLGPDSTGMKDNYLLQTEYGQVLPSHGNGDFSLFDGYSLWARNDDDQPVWMNLFINTGYTGISGIPSSDPANDTWWQGSWTRIDPGVSVRMWLDFDNAIPDNVEDNPLPHTQSGINGVSMAINAYDRTEVSAVGWQIRTEAGNSEASIVVWPDDGHTPTVALNSPEDGSVLNTDAVLFSCIATDSVGLYSATLYMGGSTGTAVFSGPAETVDTYLSADANTSIYGGLSNVEVDGSGPHAHAVIRFPGIFGQGAQQVPPGATIVSATLAVNCTNVGNTVEIYRLAEDWVEDEATWLNRTAGETWSEPGADGVPSHTGSPAFGDFSVTGIRVMDITPMAQDWSDGNPNYGLVLKDTGINGVVFESSESPNPPTLTIVYELHATAVATEYIEGTTNTVTFGPVTLVDQNTYLWNCLVSNTSGEASWASAGFALAVDTHLPDVPLLVAPLDGADGQATSPILEVTVSDPQGDSLDVTFYGKSGVSTAEFAIVVLPDTQYYSESHPEIFTAQTQWIAENAAALGIVFVTHEGDIVQNATVQSEWINAKASMGLLDAVVPYGVLPGNHDMDVATGNAPDFNMHFPYTLYESEPWYGGHYGSANNANYELISAHGQDLIIVHLPFWPSSDVITWASAILSAHPERKAIITTHGFINAGGNRTVGVMGSTQYIWDDLVVPNPNVYFVLCGHERGEYTRTDMVGNRAVHQLLADYQGYAEGGSGYLRIMRFVPALNKVYVETYSPWLNQYETDSNSQFELTLPMSDLAVLGTSEDVSSGSNASLVWPGLEADGTYEWFVGVTDPTERTVYGPLWSFSTGSGDVTPPVISGIHASDVTDSAATIVWTTDEPADSLVEYGTTTAYGSQVADSQLRLSHEVSLGELEPDTVYYYRVTSLDSSLNAAVSTNCTWVTLPQNASPVAADDGVTTAEDTGTTIDVLANDSDPDEDFLSVQSVTDPANGSAVNNGTDVTYTPDENFNGTDIFTYTVSDGKGDTDTATVTVTVTEVNDAPTADDKTVSTPEDTLLVITLTGEDVDSAPIVFTATQPAHGTLSGTGAVRTYTPDPNYNGEDSFTFVASDGTLASAAATVSITVSPVNDAPTAPQGLTATGGDSTVMLDWEDSTDPENNLVRYDVYRGTTSGTYQPLDSVAQSEFMDTEVLNGTTYYYVIKAVDGEEASSPASMETRATPGVPTYGAFVEQDPTVLFGVLGGDGVAGTATAGDGLVQTITESPNGKAGASSLYVEYLLHTTANPAEVTALTLSAAVAWSNQDVDDSLVVSIWNGNNWEDITPDVLAGSFQPTAGPQNYVDANGTIRIVFEDTAALTKEGKDTLTVDLLAAVVAAGPPDTTPPGAPIGLSAIAGDALINLDWVKNMETDVDGYNVYRSETTGGSYDQINLELVSTNAYIDATVELNTTYYYVVKAVDLAGNLSDPSNEASSTPLDEVPSAPTGLVAVPGDGQVNLVWNLNPELDVIGYDVYRSTSQNGPYTLRLNTVIVGVNSYVDTTVQNDTTYYYVVRAIDQGTHESADSSAVSATPSSQIATTVHVSSIDLMLIDAGRKWQAEATVRIDDNSGTPQTGAVVTGDWLFKGTLSQAGVSASTDASGCAVFLSVAKPARSGDEFSFVVTDVTLSGATYDQSKNSETQDSVALP